MECWRSSNEEEAIVESTVLAEICLIHHYFFRKPLVKTSLLFVKCQNTTIFEISKMYKPLYISSSMVSEKQMIIYENKQFRYE